jgi:FkbM family methyltransferase
MSFKKLVRTVQSNLWFLKEAKDAFYLQYRGLLRIPSEPFFKALSVIGKACKGGLYVDVGGNIGQSIATIKMFVPDARIVSFEPNPNLARKLVRRHGMSGDIAIHPIGLAERPGRFTLYVPSYRGFVYDGLGSLDRASAASWLGPETIYWFNPQRLSVAQYDIPVETLDMQRLQNPAFIKIDVEGTELGVLKGGVETLRQHEPILLVEGHEKPEILSLCSSLGYAPYRFDGHGFKPGLSGASPFLITPARLRWMSAHG